MFPPQETRTVTTIAFPRRPANPPKAERPDPFAKLTAQLVMVQARAGTLDPGIVAALLAAVGLEP